MFAILTGVITPMAPRSPVDRRHRPAILAALTVVLLAVAAACGDDDGAISGADPGVGEGVSVRIADKGFAESSIVAEMYASALTAGGFDASVTSLASTRVADAAIRGGEIDVYPEYTGTAYVSVLGNDGADAPDGFDEQYTAVSEGYLARGLTTLTPAPYNNGNEVACLSSAGVRSLEELSEASGSLVYSANAEHVTRDDGLPLLEKEYGIRFKDVKTVDISLRYQPIEDGDADCVYAFGTDPKLGQITDLVVLEDGRGLFTGGVGFQNFPVINTAWLEGLTDEQQSAITGALNDVDARLTGDAIRPLIAAVEFDGEDPASVAGEFLAGGEGS